MKMTTYISPALGTKEISKYIANTQDQVMLSGPSVASLGAGCGIPPKIKMTGHKVTKGIEEIYINTFSFKEMYLYIFLQSVQ